MRATAAGSALASRFVGGATAGQAAATARACASVTASAPRCSIWVNAADPAIIEQTVGQTVAACRALEAAGLDDACVD